MPPLRKGKTVPPVADGKANPTGAPSEVPADSCADHKSKTGCGRGCGDASETKSTTPGSWGTKLVPPAVCCAGPSGSPIIDPPARDACHRLMASEKFCAPP